MPTQIQQLETELAETVEQFGRDARISIALRQQLAAYRSMESGRLERFLVGTVPKAATPSVVESEEVDERADGEHRRAGFLRNNPEKLREMLDQMRKTVD